MAKILVTGGAGFIGSNLVDRLIKEGHEVVIVDDLSTGLERNLNPEAKFYKMDIREEKLAEVFATEKPDFVSHHAAQMDVRRSVREPMFDAAVNILGSLNIIENCRKHKVKKIIYISTGGAVYGEPDYLPVDEKHPIEPECQYGISKHTVEHYLHLYKLTYGLNYTVLRYPNVYGPRQNPHGEAGVNAIFIGKMLKNEVPTIFGDGKQLRDYVYVDDVVKANLLSLERGEGQIYNIGSGIGTSVNKIYQTLQGILGFQEAPKYASSRTGEIE
ncbi:MAG: NAD-dependent epimerase/dehydratase family protein, partial [Nitrospirae bacterium]|nr:NAD-dependent epimerase/dehydratase family protein [Nitrospirota bacterium]